MIFSFCNYLMVKIINGTIKYPRKDNQNYLDCQIDVLDSGLLKILSNEVFLNGKGYIFMVKGIYSW